MGTCNVQEPFFTEDGFATGVIVPGTAVIIDTTSYDGVTTSFKQAISPSAPAGIIHGVMRGVPVSGGTVSNAAAGDRIQIYKLGSNAIVKLSGTVTDPSVPLKLDGTPSNGFTPCTSNKDFYCAIPNETGAAGTYISAFITVGTVSM